MTFDDNVEINLCAECRWAKRAPTGGYAGDTALSCTRPELSVDFVTGARSKVWCKVVRTSVDCKFFTDKAS